MNIFFLLIFWTFVIFYCFYLLASDQLKIEFRRMVLKICFDEKMNTRMNFLGIFKEKE